MICSTMWVKSGVKANVSRKIYDRLTVAEPDTSVRLGEAEVWYRKESGNYHHSWIRVEVWLSNGHFGQIEIAACRYIEEVTSRQSRRIRLNPKWPQAQLQLQKTTRGDAAELNKGEAEEDMMATQKISNFHFLSYPCISTSSTPCNLSSCSPPALTALRSWSNTPCCGWSNGTKSGVSVRFGPLQPATASWIQSAWSQRQSVVYAAFYRGGSLLTVMLFICFCSLVLVVLCMVIYVWKSK